MAEPEPEDVEIDDVMEVIMGLRSNPRRYNMAQAIKRVSEMTGLQPLLAHKFIKDMNRRPKKK